MPADDHPFDALKHQFQMEGLSVSPVTKAVVAVASTMPLTWPFDKIIEWLKGHLAADSLERMGLMVETCMNEVHKHENEIKQLRDKMTAKESQGPEEVSKGLLLDAARKAESTRARERVKRIGLILANAIVELKPDGDEIEEMMRVAMNLSDHDIEFLRELIKIHASLLQTQDHVPRYDAYESWERGSWGNRIIPEIDSVFSKLESYGLVARIPPPNTLNIMADFQNRYVLLKKGLRFVTLIREAASNQGQAVA